MIPGDEEISPSFLRGIPATDHHIYHKGGRVSHLEKSNEERDTDARRCHASGSMFVMEGVSWEADSETETDICGQEVYWGVASGTFLREWGKQDWLKGEVEWL